MSKAVVQSYKYARNCQKYFPSSYLTNEKASTSMMQKLFLHVLYNFSFIGFCRVSQKSKSVIVLSTAL